MNKCVASDRAENGLFGRSVAIDGDYAVIGMVNSSRNVGSDGSAYIFKRNGASWIQEAKIVASDRAEYDSFGNSVAINGDYVVVGAYFESEDVTGGNTLINAGSAYFFKRSFVVPIELSDFKGRNTEGGNLLTWTTVSEFNTKHFNIERSTDGHIWVKIGIVAAKNYPSEYQYIDQNPKLNEVNYYRLCTVDIDGKQTFSKIVSIKFDKSFSFQLSPNPVSDILTVAVPTNDGAIFTVYDIWGRILKHQTGNTVRQQIKINDLPNGIYFLSVEQNGKFASKKFTKN